MHELKLLVNGRVQGVWYRGWIRDRAHELDLKGFARNEPDGSVTVLIQGDRELLNEFLKYVKKGSPFSRVEEVEMHIRKINKSNYKDFSIQ